MAFCLRVLPWRPAVHGLHQAACVGGPLNEAPEELGALVQHHYLWGAEHSQPAASECPPHR
eukprot:166839-Lingulodinium_polyedra.AAC.1